MVMAQTYVDLARSQLDDFESIVSQAEQSLKRALVSPNWKVKNDGIQLDMKIVVNGVEIPTKITLSPDSPSMYITIPASTVDVASSKPPPGLNNSDSEEAWEEYLDEYQNYDWYHVAERLQDKFGSDIVNSGSDLLQDMLEPSDKFGYYDLEGRG